MRRGVTDAGRPWPPAGWQVGAFGVLAAATLAVVAVNALSETTEAARGGGSAGVLPWIYELTSAASFVLLLPLVLTLVRARPPLGPGRWRRLATYAVLSLPFSLAHVALMVAARNAVVPLVTGGGYDFFGDPLRELLYEYRKDVLSFAMMVGIGEAFRRRAVSAAGFEGAEPAARSAPLPLRCGARTVFLDPARFAFARAAGNYVEVGAGSEVLLVRETLAQLRVRLDAAGVPVVQTHRSWLVSRRAVVSVRPDGDGGAVATLSDGREVPVSRSRRAALDAPPSPPGAARADTGA